MDLHCNRQRPHRHPAANLRHSDLDRSLHCSLAGHRHMGVTALDLITQEMDALQLMLDSTAALMVSPATPLASRTPLATSLHKMAAHHRDLACLALAHSTPWLPALPTPILHHILRLAGPHTRRVCRNFWTAYGPIPPTLSPCNTLSHLPRAPPPTTPTPAPDPATAPPAPATLLALPTLPATTALDLTRPFDADPTTLPRALAAITALHSLRLATPLRPAHFPTLLPHAPTLRHLASLSLGNTPRYLTPAHFSALPRFTALRSLSIHEWRGTAPAPATPLSHLAPLTALTRLSFAPLACIGNAHHFLMTEVLSLAARLPALRHLAAPVYNIEWDYEAAGLLRTLTRLTAFEGGNGLLCPPPEICSAILASLAALPALATLDLIEPIRWVPPSCLPELARLATLPLSALSISMHCECGLDLVTNEARAALVTTLAPLCPLTRLMIERVPLDVPFSPPRHPSSPPHHSKACLPCLSGVLQSLSGTLRQLELLHTIVPRTLFKALAACPLLERLVVAYPGCRSSPRALVGDAGLSYSGLGRLTGLTALAVCVEGPFDPPLPEIVGLTGLRELSLESWEPQPEELWALVPLRELTALTTGVSCAFATTKGKAATCEVLQHVAALRRVVGMDRVRDTMQPRVLFDEDIRRLAAGGWGQEEEEVAGGLAGGPDWDCGLGDFVLRRSPEADAGHAWAGQMVGEAPEQAAGGADGGGEGGEGGGSAVGGGGAGLEEVADVLGSMMTMKLAPE